jgi:hypothetical protein
LVTCGLHEIVVNPTVKVVLMKDKDNKFQGSMISKEPSRTSPKRKDVSSSDNLLLTPSEIESLRKHGKQVAAQARGRFQDLF